LAVQLPIANTFVVRAFAAFISASPVVDLFSSDMVIKPFNGWGVGGVASPMDGPA
jgi:hypothetical protein